MQTLAQIEAAIEQLSLAEQMQLMEVILQSIRQRTLPLPINEDELLAMAADSEVRRELSATDAAFLPAALAPHPITSSPYHPTLQHSCSLGRVCGESEITDTVWISVFFARSRCAEPPSFACGHTVTQNIPLLVTEARRSG